MSDIDAKVQDIKDRIAVAVRTRAAAEQARATAQTQVDTVLEQLRTEFGVTSAEDARVELASLRTCLDHTLAELTDAVNAIQV